MSGKKKKSQGKNHCVIQLRLGVTYNVASSSTGKKRNVREGAKKKVPQ